MNLHPLYTDLMRQYNLWYGEQFELALARYDADALDAAPEILIDTQAWFDQSVTVTDAATDTQLFSGCPRDLLAPFADPQQILDLAWAAAALCDEALPTPVAERLLSDEGLRDQMLPALLAADWQQIQSDYEDPQSLALSRLIETLGPALRVDQLVSLLDHYMSISKPDELVTAALKTALASQHSLTVPLLTDRLQQALAAGQAVEGPVEALMICLAEAGAQGHGADAFDVMRTAFRRAANKQIAAICLSDFNDPRGIAVLRSWLESHPDTDRTTKLEIVAAIKRLGGEI